MPELANPVNADLSTGFTVQGLLKSMAGQNRWYGPLLLKEKPNPVETVAVGTAGCPAPPAQIPACATNALGSYLGYDAQALRGTSALSGRT